MTVRLTWKLTGFLVCVVVADIIAIGIYFSMKSSSPTSSDSSSDEDTPAPLPPSDAVMGVYDSAAVVADPPCAEIGKNILANGGNAVDAAIGALLCDGVRVMYAMGVGGGFLMTIYNRTTGETNILVARESAPGAATQDMYVNHTNLATLGALAAAVPGELKGYQAAYERFGGRVPWRDLFEPTIQICEEGVTVSKNLEKKFISAKSGIDTSPTFKSVVLNSTGGVLAKEGEKLKLPELANTLRVIAESSIRSQELYNGSLTQKFAEDIQAGGGIITVEDMNNYEVTWKLPYNASLSNNLTVHSASLPGSGILLTFMLRLLDGLFQFANSDIERSQLVVEAFKHAYGRRTDLSDEDIPGNKTLLDEAIRVLTDQDSILSIRNRIKSNWTSNNVSYYGADYFLKDHGTNHICVIDSEGNAVSVTSTINLYFGSKFVSKSTGIILNNQMDDFSTPGLVNSFGVSPSSANFISPGKRPQSSMSPTIVVDSSGDVRLIVGAAGGSQITTQTTLTTVRNLWMGKNIKEALDEARFHHQLLPMNIVYEYGVLKEMVDAWKQIGHNVSRVSSDSYLATATGIARLGEKVTACYDHRRPAGTSGI